MVDFKEWIESYGACLLVVLTIVQFLFFVGYSAFYTVIYIDYNPDTTITRTELYQWISMLILTIGMFYFLWTSIKEKPQGKHKNPNELYSYLALGVINNSIFLAKLGYYSYKIKNDWIDGP